MRPDEIAQRMYEAGWVKGERVARSQLWVNLTTGAVYRFPVGRSVDFDRCWDEVLMLSPT